MTSSDASADLLKKYMAPMPNAIHWNGFVWPEVIDVDFVASLKDAEFGADDVIVVSYPKSGTTWCSEVLSGIAHEGDTETIKKTDMLERVPWMEINPALSPATNKPASTSAKKRVYFTHLPIHMLPTSIREGKSKVIYVARNPKDMAVSYYHFHRSARFLGRQTSLAWNDFFTFFCTGIICCGSWFEHVLTYWKFTQNNPNAVFVKYEDMKRDLVEEMKALENFIGVPLNEEQRKKVIDHCSFDSMKNNQMANKDDNVLIDSKVSKFMRKGVVGDYKNYFTVAQNEQFDELYKEKMAGSGLDFEFE